MKRVQNIFLGDEKQPKHIQKILTYISLQFLLSTLLLLITQFKHEIYQLISYRLSDQIYLVSIIFVGSVYLLKLKGGKNMFFDIIMFLVITVTLSWCIIYPAGYFGKEQILNFSASLSASVLGLKYFTKSKGCNFIESANVIGGLFSSTIGIIIAINLLSYLFVPFNVLYMSISLLCSILLSLSLMKYLGQTINLYQAESSYLLKNIAGFYWNIPVYIVQKLKSLLKIIVDFELI